MEREKAVKHRNLSTQGKVYRRKLYLRLHMLNITSLITKQVQRQYGNKFYYIYIHC